MQELKLSGRAFFCCDCAFSYIDGEGNLCCENDYFLPTPLCKTTLQTNLDFDCFDFEQR